MVFFWGTGHVRHNQGEYGGRDDTADAGHLYGQHCHLFRGCGHGCGDGKRRRPAAADSGDAGAVR